VKVLGAADESAAAVQEILNSSLEECALYFDFYKTKQPKVAEEE